MEAIAARWGLLLALMLAPVAAAQDAHYWTRQFGNRAWLLGGALVGNPGDISAVYYNPGALALLDKPEIELAGSVYELTRLSVESGSSERDAVMWRANSLPSLIAGSARFGFLGKSKLAYSFITRQGFSFTLESRESLSGADVIGGPSGLEQLAANVRFDENVGEYWAGLTWAYPLAKSLGVGLTAFGAVRHHEVDTLVLAQGSGSGGQTILSNLGQDFTLDHARLLAKLGVSYQSDSWAMGLALTTPSLGVWGSGQAGFERALVEQGFGLTSVPAPVFNYQDSLDVKFKSSWSLALGGRWTRGRTTVHVAAEGFVRQEPFKLIDTEPFSPQGSSEVIDPDVFFGHAPVVNVAVGVEQRLSPKVRAYVSAHTDFSAWTETPTRNALVSAWDIYHGTFGFYFNVGRSRFTLGSNVAWGRQSTQRLAENLAEAGFPPPSSSQKVRFFQATFIVGASIELLDEGKSSGDTGEPETIKDDGGK